MEVNQPTNVQATATGPTTVNVTWTNAQTTHDNNEVEYQNVTDSGSWTTASAAIAANATEYEVTGLTATKEYNFRVTALNTAVAQIDEIDAVADSGGSLDGLYFDVADADGPVRVWFDVDDSGTAAPATPLGGRLIEVTGIVTDDNDAAVAAAVASAIDADSEFTATVPSGSTIRITQATAGDVDGIDAGTSTFTNATTATEGVDGDSDPAEAVNSVFTWPSTSGQYWAARTESAPSDWTHIINLTQGEPFLNGTALGLTTTARTQVSIRPKDWAWGPEITKPNYPGGS